MKYIVLAMFVLFATLPAKAASCAMQADQEMSHSQAVNMHHPDSQPMDCCDHDPADTPDSCDPISHCSAGSAGSVTIDSATLTVYFSVTAHQYLPAATAPVFRPHSPPFRPPIA